MLPQNPSFGSSRLLICKRIACGKRKSLLDLKVHKSKFGKYQLDWKRVEKGRRCHLGGLSGVSEGTRPGGGGHMRRSQCGEAAELCPPAPRIHREASRCLLSIPGHFFN